MVIRKLRMQAALGLLIATLVLSASCDKLPGPKSPGQIIEDVSLEEAFALMVDNQGRGDFVILDLRPAEEYARGYIEEAINLDYGSPDFLEALEGLDRDRAYLIYSYRDDVSGKVMDAMTDLGFAEVYNMLGGIEHWAEIGLPQVK